MNASPVAAALHDADAYCASALERLATCGPGEACVVFDIDNTLVDTRHRTAAAARAFAQQHLGDAHPLARIGAADVGYDGLATGARAGLEGSQLAAFDAFWSGFFWNPENFVQDAPIEATSRWAHAAAAAGARVVYLTGRVRALHRDTLEQLRRLGYPVGQDDDLVCKPAAGQDTASYKVAALADLLRWHTVIGWFMTESLRDVATTQQRLADRVPCVLVEFPLHAGDLPVAVDTPVLRTGLGG